MNFNCRVNFLSCVVNFFLLVEEGREGGGGQLIVVTYKGNGKGFYHGTDHGKRKNGLERGSRKIGMVTRRIRFLALLE